MADPEDFVPAFHMLVHLHTVVYTGGHGLLAQDVVALGGKRLDKRGVELILQ